ncbi:VWA domain-containing protein (plasmid) [Salipiger sp. H15]|uniref:VWA domain-containing protein n=1 Tax=Alloyangia sp. H15 TaxID=3029062 RepID=A0AAU8ATQ1_9RHOB
MSFAFPLAALLLPLPLLLLWLAPPERHAPGALALPPAPAEAARPARATSAARHARLVLPGLAWVLVVMALSGPRVEQVFDILSDSARDIVLVLDLSGSMEREDFSLDGRQVSRLAAVQSVAARFVEGRAGDRVGLVVFGDRAYVAAAPTQDVAAVAQVIGTTRIGVSGKATAIADGLGLAIKRLRERDAKSRVVILLSDGQDTSGAVDPVATAEVAKDLGIRIHTIALGPQDLETAPGTRDAVDTATLRDIAQLSGGTMFRVRTTDDLRAVTEAIDTLEPSPAKAPPIRGWRELWVWPAAAALVLLAIALYLTGREAA